MSGFPEVRIYLIGHGERRSIPTKDVYKHLFGTDNLQEVRSAGKNFDDIREGDPFWSDDGLWPFADEPSKIYLFDTGEYRCVNNSEILKQYGFDHGSVHEGAPNMLKGHIGEPA